MNLGIDLDGVVYNSEEWFKAFGEVYDMAKGGNGPIDKTTSDIQDRFGLADDEARALRLKYLPVQIMTSPLMPYAKEALKRLEKDHNIYFISLRGVIHPSHEKYSDRRLKKDKIRSKGNFYHQRDKLSVCQDLKIDLMVDDSYSVVKNLAENGIKCLYFKAIESPSLRHKNVKTVTNWGEVLREIDKLAKEEK